MMFTGNESETFLKKLRKKKEKCILKEIFLRTRSFIQDLYNDRTRRVIHYSENGTFRVMKAPPAFPKIPVTV